jgi:disulfide oxidoreductase YuzD
MYELWEHAQCPKEGIISNIVHVCVHEEIIDFMFQFLKKKYPNICYTKEYKKVELPF